jgi:DNA-binding transcriptional LysR family regulator
VLFSRAASPDYHAQIVEMCAAAGLHPRVCHELRHWLSVVALVSQGMGVAAVPAPLARSGIAGVVFRPLVSGGASTELRCAWRAEDPPAPGRAAFLEVVLAESGMRGRRARVG